MKCTLRPWIRSVSMHHLGWLLACMTLAVSSCTPATRQLVSMGGEADLGKRLVQERKYDEAIVELERVIFAEAYRIRDLQPTQDADTGGRRDTDIGQANLGPGDLGSNRFDGGLDNFVQ